MTCESNRCASLLLACCLLLSGLAAPSGAQTTRAPEQTTSPAPIPEVEEIAPRPRAPEAQRPTTTSSLRGDRETSLAGILAAQRRIEADLRALQDSLESDDARGRQEEIEAEIRVLAEELAELSRNFSELAAGVDPLSVEAGQQAEDLDLTREVRDLVGPLVSELKRATSRPREIDRLRTDIGELEERLASVNTALARLASLKRNLRVARVIEAIEEEEHDWARSKSALDTQLQVARQKLRLRLDESQSITQAVENLFQLFFKSRGRNLLLALLATVGFLYVFRRLRAFLAGRAVLAGRSESFEGRVIGLVLSAFTVIGALLVFLIALYFFGDWVLLILMLLLLLGIIWTSKQAIPRFWSQAVLILDMGAVREGERVSWNGLPWLVESISFYSILSNPELVGGLLRLPIDDLAALRSRPYDPTEPWFPTRRGDVVLLADGRPGEVEFQSVEGVRLRMPGENRSIVPAAEFAGQAVEKISGGYRVDITFGLDYGDQAEITTSMREIMLRGIEARWQESRWADSAVGFSVEFKEAGASSLDYFIRVDLDGSQAFDYQAQRRALATFAVEICNQQGWVIPFTQLTLHVAESGGDSGGDSSADSSAD